MSDTHGHHGVAEREGTVIGRFLPGHHMAERRLTGAVGTDHADDGARRNFKAQIVDQHPVVEPFAQMLGLDDQIAKPGTRRNGNLLLVGRPVSAVGDQLIEGVDARLAFSLACARALANPFELTANGTLVRAFLFSS